ncbi:unnamed protein product [Leuciscus chuanchicus]
MNELLDVLVEHYYHVLDPKEEHKYRSLLYQVFERHELSVEEKARIQVLQQEQAVASRTGTQVNQDRKAQISVLITEFQRMKVMINLFRGVLPTFQRFAKKLQHEKLMVHLVHVEMVALVRELLGKFMRPKAIPLSHKEILKVDVRRRHLQQPNKRLSVGQFCYIAMNKAQEIGQLVEECRAYQLDGDMLLRLQSYSRCPLVEGSFNLMDDILEDDRCSMNVETYESLAVIKSTLKARDRTASTL